MAYGLASSPVHFGKADQMRERLLLGIFSFSYSIYIYRGEVGSGKCYR
jgi:hypothetical protein